MKPGVFSVKFMLKLWVDGLSDLLSLLPYLTERRRSEGVIAGSSDHPDVTWG